MTRADCTGRAKVPFRRCAVAPPSRAEIERGVARGRRLQGEAVQAAFRRLLRALAVGTNLRRLRAPASLAGRRHSCC